MHKVLHHSDIERVELDEYVQLDQVTWGPGCIHDKDIPLSKNYEPNFGNDDEVMTVCIMNTYIYIRTRSSKINCVKVNAKKPNTANMRSLNGSKVDGFRIYLSPRNDRSFVSKREVVPPF